MKFFFVRESVVSYVAFVLSLFIPHLSFFLCLGKATLCDCGISWVSSFIPLLKYTKQNFVENRKKIKKKRTNGPRPVNASESPLVK